MYIYIYIRVYKNIHTKSYIIIIIYIYIYIYMYVCIFLTPLSLLTQIALSNITRTQTHTYTYIHLHLHVRIYTHIGCDNPSYDPHTYSKKGNEMELFGTKLNYWELKWMKRNVLGVSLQGMSLSIGKPALSFPHCLLCFTVPCHHNHVVPSSFNFFCGNHV